MINGKKKPAFADSESRTAAAELKEKTSRDGLLTYKESDVPAYSKGDRKFWFQRRGSQQTIESAESIVSSYYALCGLAREESQLEYLNKHHELKL